MIQRRADQFAEAGVDTVIHFGFHFRFDFAWYFGSVHGLLADIADALHERNIRFLDHYSCNLVARPGTRDQLINYHTGQRHHIAIHPDPIAAEKAEYAGYRLNDLREIDVETGEPTYLQAYQCEMFCHNNPDFLAMHESYIKRQLAEIPLDGFMMDDMCCYGAFRTCGCRHCREKFQRDYGHELPPVTDKKFWGDTSGHPMTWGNYDNKVFLDWVRMRYQTVSNHLKLVRTIIGPEKILMTCCSSSGPSILNSYGLSYERFIETCDWVMMENCGLSAETIKWASKEPEAMLHKAISETKAGSKAPCVALSYFLFDDGAYLGWAIARFWGVQNWASTNLGIPIEPMGLKEDVELVGPFNRWEIQNSELGMGEDVVDVQIAFVRANRENGWRDTAGMDHWDRVRKWAQACIEQNIGYRFVLTDELGDAAALLARTVPLILDGCSHLSDRQINAIRDYLRQGGRLGVVAPLGMHDEMGNLRADSFLTELQTDENLGRSVFFVDSEQCAEELMGWVRSEQIKPRIRLIDESGEWAVRGRLYGDQLAVHIMNRALAGVEHPELLDRGGAKKKVLQEIVSKATADSAILEIDFRGMACRKWQKPVMLSPEFSAPRSVTPTGEQDQILRWKIPLNDLKLYAVVNDESLRKS
jgi:hypothetical protein